MKSLSSSIVVMAGALLTSFNVGRFLPPHSVLGVVPLFAGLVTLGIGLAGWVACLKHDR